MTLERLQAETTELPLLDAKDRAITSSSRLMAALQSKFCPPEWAMFEEVSNSTGFEGSGYADAVAMNTYPSRGLLVHGFELKVSRSDWLRELKAPAKAETIFGYCDHWWLVVGDKSIVKPGELPQPWGLIAPRGDGLAIIHQAPKLEAKPLTRGFVAALVRRAQAARDLDIGDKVEEATKSILDDYSRRLANSREDDRTDAGRLQKLVNEFEKASGIELRNGWHGTEKIGAVVKLLLEHGVSKQRNHAEYALTQVKMIEKDLVKLIAELP